VLLHTEEPYETTKNLARAARADLNLVNDPVNLERFRQVAPTVYMPHAYRPALHRPGPVRAECVSDFCFVGTGYPSRIAFFEQVGWDGIDVALAGNWQWLDDDSPLRKHLCHDIGACCHNEETVDLYRATKVAANLYRREAESDAEAGWSMGPREVELAATGTFFLREPRGEGDQVLPMLPTFDGPGDFGDQLRWWLAHEDQRRIAAMAAQLAISGRTFENNARALLELLGH
jgi:spore maturation protein CgeB